MAIKIPNETKRLLQPNNSDLFGNIWYTKNINFDEEGYIKVSSRVVNFKSEEDDTNFDLPLSFGRISAEFIVLTVDQVYNLNTVVTNFSVAEDATSNTPTLSIDGWGKWFNGRWHASAPTKIWYATSTTSGWTDTALALTSGKIHVLEVFRSKNSLAYSNGNTVVLVNTSYGSPITLTLPADYEVTSLSYNGNRMAVGTMTGDSAVGQGQEAYFFLWDGAGSSAGEGYGVGSDMVVAIAPYKSSWVILTRNGELKYFNGGGFDNLAQLPFHFKNTNWGDGRNREGYGDIMQIEGDLIYINIGNDFSVSGKTGESYIQNNPAGIWCFDPKVGLYHRYAGSISPAYFIDVLSAGINTSTDIITANSGTLPSTGSPIIWIYDPTSAVGGLVCGKQYWIIKHTSTTFSLAESREKALAGLKVDITSANNSNFLGLELRDYGANRAVLTGGIGIVEERRRTSDHLLFGIELFDYNSTTDYRMLNITVPGFHNIGYFVTAKVNSSQVTDNSQKIYIKYKPLDTDEKIILRFKEKDVLGFPVTTSQFGSSTLNCTWSSDNELSTTSNLSAVETYLNESNEHECEVEIINGAGAGQMAKISSISSSGGVYIINLSENIEGVVGGNNCDIIVDNFKELGVVTEDDTDGWKEFPISVASKWVKIKTIIKGFEVTVEELLLVSETQISAI